MLEFLRQFESSIDAGDQFIAADRLFDEIQAPAFIASTAIGTSLLPVIMIAGSDGPRHGASEQFDRSTRQIRVDQQARGIDRERKASRNASQLEYVFDHAAMVLEHGSYRLTNQVVVRPR